GGGLGGGPGVGGRGRAGRALGGLPSRLFAREHGRRDVALPGRAHARALRRARHSLAGPRRRTRVARLPGGARRHLLSLRIAGGAWDERRVEHPFAPLPALEPESEAYWTACREGRLELTRCRACRWFVHPSRPVCSRCRCRDVAPETLSGLGTVVTYTVNHQRWMPGLEVPYLIAIVELVEQQNLRLTTNIVGCP